MSNQTLHSDHHPLHPKVLLLKILKDNYIAIYYDQVCTSPMSGAVPSTAQYLKSLSGVGGVVGGVGGVGGPTKYFVTPNSS
jgi:hypothetical protein